MRADPRFFACLVAAAVVAATAAGAGGEAGGRKGRQPGLRHQPERRHLSVVDLATLKASDPIKIGGKPAGIAISADKKSAYVTAPEGKELIVVDAASRAITRRIKVGEGPLGVAAPPSQSRVYVADWYTHKVFVVDPEAGAITGEHRRWRIRRPVLALTPDGKLLLSADRDSNEVSVRRYDDEHARPAASRSASGPSA